VSNKSKTRFEIVAVVLTAGLVAGGVLFLSGTGPKAAPGPKNVICHFVGHLGADRFHRIECGSGCVNGPFEDGNPLAGHERDILNPPGGLCPGGPDPSPDPSPLP
jgi:hypothetical protein